MSNKLILDSFKVDYFGEADREFPDRKMDDYDLMGQEVADFLRERMTGKLEHQAIVEVVDE